MNEEILKPAPVGHEAQGLAGVYGCKLIMQWLKTILVVFMLTGFTARAEDGIPGDKNAESPFGPRVAGLLKRMTLEEKIAQLRADNRSNEVADAGGNFDPTKARLVFGAGLGGFGSLGRPIREEVAFRNAVQKFMRENTRLGIPLIFHAEGCHGYLSPAASSFPVPIGIAGSWDEELIERIYAAVGAEMRSRGVDQALTPVVDICRDPRWGRTDETLGEDPFLNGRLATAMVRGLQGRDPEHIGAGHIAATLKHFTGHGQPEAGVNRAPVHLGRRELYESHLVPFAMVVAAAQPAAVMPSYNEIDGVPAHANRWLLQAVLRGQFGFDGLITSDYSGISDLRDFHHIAATDADAALRAFAAGVDMDFPVGKNYAHLAELVKAGKISEAAINERVARVLRLKFRLGLFENPYADADAAEALLKQDSTKALALEAAQKSVVLLKNQNGLLPLAPGKYKTIAVIGPHAADTRLGSYSGEPLYNVSILDGVKRAVGDGAKILYAKGCSITTNEGPSPMRAWNFVDRQQLPTAEADRVDSAQAVKLASQADVIILVLGENELICREAWSDEHFGDRASLDLFGRQNELADELFKLGKPVVVYLMNGRPLAIPHIVESAAAVLEGWYAGQETGHAVADILFGQVNPSGKLTITIPREVGQLPIYYNHKPSSRGFAYVDADNRPLFPFGFGLSYTTYEYGEPRLRALEMKTTGSAEVSTTVTNSGKVAGDEIVQLYIHQKVASVTRPVRELKGFQRISLAPGESKVVRFSITPDMLALYDEDLKRVVEPGEFEIIVGPSSDGGKIALLRVVE
jgi:beta-glucosidase